MSDLGPSRALRQGLPADPVKKRDSPATTASRTLFCSSESTIPGSFAKYSSSSSSSELDAGAAGLDCGS